MTSKTIATMKNIFKSVMLVAVAAMAFTACTQENNEMNAVKKGTTLTISAGLADNDTRVAFGDLENGVRKTLWEAGDKVTFVAYRNDQIFTYVNDLEVEADGEVANFTVDFPESLQNGDRIEALVGQYISSYNWSDVTYYYTYTHEYQQYPTDAGFSTVYVKAVANYEGNDNISLTFNHMYPYGKLITDYTVKFTQIDFTFEGETEDGNDDTAYANIYPVDITGDTYWFYCTNELYNITNINITAKDSEYTTYTFSKNIDSSKGFKFEVGKISAFTVNDFLIVLDSPWVQATETTTDSITFDWDDVENATGYDVVISKGNDEVIAEESITKSEYVATGLESNVEYTISVVATTTTEGYTNSNKATSSAKTEADSSALDTQFTNAVTFTKMAKVELYDSVYENAYKFTTDGGGTTRNDDFMFLKFFTDITAQDGVYEGSDLDLSWCYCWLASNPAGWSEGNGYSDNYGLGFKPYHCYMNQGDTYIVYVDVDEENPGTLSITAYLNNAAWWADAKFKGSFTGTISDAETPTAGNAGADDRGDIVEGEEFTMTATRVEIIGRETNDQYFTFYDSEGNMLYFNWYNNSIWKDSTLGYTPTGGSLIGVDTSKEYSFTYDYWDGTITCSGRFVLNDGRILVLEEVTLSY